MGKVFTLLCVMLLALGSIGGYLFLTEKIIAGKLKIAAGQKQLDEGEEMLAKGKVKLSEGKQKLSQVKKVHNTIRGIPFMEIANKLPVSGTVFKMASNKIAEGDQQVAKGKEKIKAGEAQLEVGKLELGRGKERLSHADGLRIICMIGGVFFSTVLIFFGFYWRESLIQILRCKWVKF